MFIFEKAPFQSCHASTVVEHAPGKLLAAWFGGDREGAANVEIWGSTFDGTKWSAPELLGREPGQPCWNPVLFRFADRLWLWYKAGPSPMTWTGFVRTSADGKAWSKPEMMPAGFYGPVRAKPIRLADGTLLAGTSVESHRCWTPFADRSADGVTWLRSNAFNVPGGHGQIQPALFEAAPGGPVVALMRSRDPRAVCRAESKDGGKTFGPAEPTDLPNPSTGVDVVTTAPGEVFLVGNPVTKGRTPLSLARSTDAGKTWKRVLDLETEPGEYSYPAMILSAKGSLDITYTWRRTHIKHVTVDPAKYR